MFQGFQIFEAHTSAAMQWHLLTVKRNIRPAHSWIRDFFNRRIRQRKHGVPHSDYL